MDHQKVFEIGMKLGSCKQAIDNVDFHSMWEWAGDDWVEDMLDRMLELWMEYDKLIREDREVVHMCCICREKEATIYKCKGCNGA